VSRPNPHGVTLRDATPEDYAVAAELLLAAYDEYRHHMPPERWERYAQDIADVSGRAAGSTLILAELKERLVGAVTFTSSDNGEHWPSTHASLRLLAVHSEARRLGVAQALMAECVRRTRALGRTHLGLHTTAFMAGARALYQRLGFRPVPAQNMQFGTITIEALELDLASPPTTVA